jgi:hypothetical protein
MRELILAALTAAAIATPAVAQPGPMSTRDEDVVLAGTEQWMRRALPAPDDALFRQVHFRFSTGRDGVRQMRLCGQIDPDGAAGPDGWTVFAAAFVVYETWVTIGPNWLVDVEAACGQALHGWDRTRDFAPRLDAALQGAPRRPPLSVP